MAVTEEKRGRLAKFIKDKVVIDKEVLRKSRDEWKNSLDGKFLGTKIPVQFLREKIKEKWPLSCNVQVLDHTNGYYYFKFEAFDNIMDVWEGNPWIFYGKILVLNQ